MKFAIRACISFTIVFLSCWLMGLVFFCIIPPIVLPVITYTWWPWGGVIWGGLAAIFALVLTTKAFLEGVNKFTIRESDYDLLITGDLAVVEVGPCGPLRFKKVFEIAEDDKHPFDAKHVKGNWLDGYSVTFFYDNPTNAKICAGKLKNYKAEVDKEDKNNN